MSKGRAYIGISEAQSDALYRRDHSYSDTHAASVRVQFDWRQRQPKSLREAVSMARALHAAEVPSKLHEGPDSIGPDGTPKMTARAEGYIFGDERSDDAPRNPETGARDPIGYYHAPFRARLAEMDRGDERTKKRAAIVAHVTIGGQSPVEAAISEGVPSWCAGEVAEKALMAFLHSMSDMKLHLGRQSVETVTAA